MVDVFLGLDSGLPYRPKYSIGDVSFLGELVWRLGELVGSSARYRQSTPASPEGVFNSWTPVPRDSLALGSEAKCVELGT